MRSKSKLPSIIRTPPDHTDQARKTHQGKVAADNGARAEALHGTVRGLVPVAERLRAQAVCGVLAHGADEEVADSRRGRDGGCPDGPICGDARKRD